MKRILGIILTLCILFACGTHTVSANDNAVTQDNKVKLSTMTQEQCMQFLLECGITIPGGYENVGFSALFAELEKDPYMPIFFNDVIFSAFCEEIKIAVNAYYGVPLIRAVEQTRYTLQDSDVYAWDSTMTRYNCYAYVLGDNTEGYNPGHFSNSAYDNTQIIEVIANLVEADLTSEELGYHCVKRQHTLPTTTVGWDNVIAVRKDIDHPTFNDFHFAVLTSAGWLHKPSTTAVLEFKAAPSNSYRWTNECYDGRYYYEGSITYDSDIVYFSYKVDHGNLTEKWLGDHYHLGATHCYVYKVICDDCGTQVETVIKRVPCAGPPCLVSTPTLTVGTTGEEID